MIKQAKTVRFSLQDKIIYSWMLGRYAEWHSQGFDYHSDMITIVKSLHVSIDKLKKCFRKLHKLGLLEAYKRKEGGWYFVVYSIRDEEVPS